MNATAEPGKVQKEHRYKEQIFTQKYPANDTQQIILASVEIEVDLVDIKRLSVFHDIRTTCMLAKHNKANL